MWERKRAGKRNKRIASHLRVIIIIGIDTADLHICKREQDCTTWTTTATAAATTTTMPLKCIVYVVQQMLRCIRFFFLNKKALPIAVVYDRL